MHFMKPVYRWKHFDALVRPLAYENNFSDVNLFSFIAAFYGYHLRYYVRTKSEIAAACRKPYAPVGLITISVIINCLLTASSTIPSPRTFYRHGHRTTARVPDSR